MAGHSLPDSSLEHGHWISFDLGSRAQGLPAIVLLLSLSALLFFYELSAGELYRTESLRAIVAAEFLRGGNWIVPRLYGEPLLTKPPGHYAAIAAVSWFRGEVSEWSARLPSALSATITVLLFYWYFSRQLGRLGGLVAAAGLPLSFMWLDKASTAEIDMMQTAWVSAAILFFLRALEQAEDDGDTHIGWWLAALLCVAGGVLTKWTAPAFFYGTAVPLLWWRGRLRLLWGPQHIVSAVIGASVCLAWAGAVASLVGWSTFFHAVGSEAWMKFAPSHHRAAYPLGGTLMHPFLLLAAGLPWSAFAVVSLWPHFADLWDERGRRLLQAMHCWVWPNLIFWSLVPEHSPRHALPLFGGIAGLGAMVWFAWLTGKLNWRAWPVRLVAATPVRALVSLVALWLVVKLAFVHVIVPGGRLGALPLTIPGRNVDRQIRTKGQQLAAAVPDGHTLYVFRLKDEGIMFYYGRVVARLKGPTKLPSSAMPVYCILDESEWMEWKCWPTVHPVLHLTDGQGEPIVLVSVVPAALPRTE
jgi:4-amino-4-deoxy-L-arabinose transferase-like glycosyltransferase